jgi:hypothetical protein
MRIIVAMAVVGLASVTSTWAQDPAPGQQESTLEPGSSSSESYYRRGVGFKGSNIFDPKYKQRLKNYAEQIEMGMTRGWLSPEQGTHFKTELERLTKLEATVSAAGYPKEQLDDLEKQVTQFNIDLTSAGSQKSATPVANPDGDLPPLAPDFREGLPKPEAMPAAKPIAKSVTTSVKKTVAKPAVRKVVVTRKPAPKKK